MKSVPFWRHVFFHCHFCLYWLVCVCVCEFAFQCCVFGITYLFSLSLYVIVCVWVCVCALAWGGVVCLSLTLWSLISLAVRVMDTDGQDCVCSLTLTHTHSQTSADSFKQTLPHTLIHAHTYTPNSVTHSQQLMTIHWVVSKLTIFLLVRACVLNVCVLSVLQSAVTPSAGQSGESTLLIVCFNSFSLKVPTILQNICLIHFQSHSKVSNTAPHHHQNQPHCFVQPAYLLPPHFKAITPCWFSCHWGHVFECDL